MTRNDRSSAVSLRLDLLTAKLLVWMARVGRDADLTEEAHRYFFDRYSRLAEYHRGRGHLVRAEQLEVKAEEHRCDGDDGPPYAAAMGLSRPRVWLTTEAVGRSSGGPDTAA
jgi:hypothetical protein